MARTDQSSLFDAAPALPPGFRYQPDALHERDERALLDAVRGLPFKAFEFHGFLGKRRIVSFGWSYDFSAQRVAKVDDIPDFLHPVREQAARVAGLAASALQQVLVTEYKPGAAIGWHKDKSVFGEVAGVSLLSPCIFRLRRKTGTSWQRASLTVEPRSVYVLQGPARTEWEHSIPAVEQLRYSLTFRNFAVR